MIGNCFRTKKLLVSKFKILQYCCYPCLYEKKPLTVGYLMVGEESAVLRVNIEPAYRQVSSGERVELDCSAPGQPPPSLAWSRAGGVPLGLRVRLQCIFYLIINLI